MQLPLAQEKAGKTRAPSSRTSWFFVFLFVLFACLLACLFYPLSHTRLPLAHDLDVWEGGRK